MSTINSDEHDAKHGARSGPKQPLALEHRDKPGALSSQPGHSKSKGESVSGAEQRRAKRAGEQRRRTVSTDLYVTKTILSLCIVLGSMQPTASHASCTFGALARGSVTGFLDCA